MLRALPEAVSIRVVLSILLLFSLSACEDSVGKYKTAAGLRAQIERDLQQMEGGRQVPGLSHRHVTVEPDADVNGFAVKVTEMKLGDPKLGFQAFNQMTFSLAQADATHFNAGQFSFSPEPVGKGPTEASETLVQLLQRAASTLHSVEE